MSDQNYAGGERDPFAQAVNPRHFPYAEAQSDGGDDRQPTFEPLEPRLLMAADLTTAFGPLRFLDTDPGVRQVVDVTVGNLGDQRAGRTQLDIYAAPVGQAFDPNTATLLESRQVGSTGAGDSSHVPTSVVIPPTLKPGSYRLVAVTDASNRVGEDNEGNNVGESDTFTVNQLDFDLSNEVARTRNLASGVVAGEAKRAMIVVRITNGADTTSRPPRRATVPVLICARPVGATDASQDIMLNRRDVDVNVSRLRPGASRNVRVPIEFPAGLDEGAYEIVVKVDPENTLVDTNMMNAESVLEGSVITVADPFVDIAAAIGGNVNLPNAVVSGDGTTLRVPVQITNNGNVRTNRGERVSVTIEAVPQGGGAAQVIDMFVGVNIGGLNPGRSRNVTFSTQLPPGLVDGNYTLRVHVDSEDILEEPNENDNFAQTGGAINVAEGFVDLSPAIVGNATIPSAVVSGNGAPIRLPVQITNNGNVSIPNGQNIVARITAQNVMGGPVHLIDTIANLGVGGLGAGQSRTFTLNTTLPAGIPDGEFAISVEIDSTDVVDESNESNNTITANQTVTVAEGFFDLVAAFAANLNLPSAVVAGDGTNVTLPVVVTNNGNLRTPNGTLVTFAVDAVDGGVTNIDNIGGFNVGGLNPGQSRTFNVNTSLPVNLPEDLYNLRVRIDSTDELDESDDTINNTITTGQTINVAEGFVDLVPDVVSNNLPPAVVSGDGTSGSVVVDVFNQGNVNLPSGQQVDIVVSLRPVGGGADVEIGRVNGRSVSGLRPGNSVRQSVSVTVPGALADGDYTTVVEVQPSAGTPLAEDTGNNEVADSNVNVAEGFFDLLAAFGGNLNLPNAVVSGDGTNLALPVVVTNNGNLRTPNNTLIDIDVDVVNGMTTGLGTFNGFNVGGLNPGQSRTFNINASIPPGVLGMVNVLATIDASDVLDESDDVTNNMVTSPTQIDVQLGFVDLQPIVFNNTLPPAAVSGAGTGGTVTVDVRNNGNVNLPGGSTVDIVVSLRPVGGGALTEIGRLNGRSVANLAPNATVRSNINVTVPGALADGDYETVVQIVTVVNESTTANNEVTDNAITIAAGFLDLVASFGATLNLPANAVSGAGTNLALPIVVTNNGNLATPANTLVDILVEAANGSVHTLTMPGGFNVGGLNPGQSRSFNVNTTLPIGVPTGMFNIRATVDASDTVDESDDTVNNVVTSAQVINVTQGFRDLQPINISDNINTSVVAGSAQASGTINLSIRNNGNLPLPAGQLADVIVTITPVGGGEPIEIGRLNGTSVANLGAGASVAKAVNVVIDANTPDNDYTIDVLVQPSAGTPLTESTVANNEGTPGNVSVDPAMNDIFATNFSETFAPNVIAGAAGTVSYSIRNNGNVPLPAGQLVDVTVALRPDGGGPDVVIATANGLNVGGQAPGTTSNHMLNATIPGNTDPDLYAFVVTVNPSAGTPLAETDVNNNVNVTAALVNVAEAFVDLGLLTATTTLGSQREGGDTAVGNVTLANAGNVPVTGNALVEFFFTVSGNPDTDGVLLGSANQAFNVGANNVQILPNIDLTVPFFMEQTVGEIVARITPSNLSMADQDTNDYQLQLIGHTLTIVPTIPFVGDIIGNLSFDTETLYLPSSVPGFGLITASAQGQANSDTNYNTGYQYNVNYQTLPAQAIINLFPDGTIDGGHTIAPQWVLTLDFNNAGLRPDHIVGHTIRIVENNGPGVDGMATISGLLLNGVLQPDETFFFTFD